VDFPPTWLRARHNRKTRRRPQTFRDYPKRGSGRESVLER